MQRPVLIVICLRLPLVLGHCTPTLRATCICVQMQVAYLASTLFLDSNSDLIVLIVNTITHDLADDNMLIGVHARPCKCGDPCLVVHVHHTATPSASLTLR